MGMKMKRTKQIALSLLLSLIFLLLCACAPRMAGLQHDESFDYNAAVAGGIAVAGVTSTFAEFPPDQQNQLAEIFRRTIIDEREKYRLLSPGVLGQKLGKEYPDVLEQFRASGALGLTELSVLQKSNIPARYLLMTRIEKHSNSQDREESAVYNDKGKETNKAQVSLQSIAEVAAFASIYDLKRGVSVWSGSLTQRKTNENTFETYRGGSLEKMLKDTAVGVLLGNEAAGREYPEEPRFKDVVAKVFRGFAANLPKKK